MEHPLDRPEETEERVVRAKVIDDAPYQFRFGIGSLLGLTTLYSVVFATAWYLGGAGTSLTILGLAAALLFGETVALLVVAVRPDSKFTQIARMEQWLVLTLAATTFTIVPMLFLSGGQIYSNYVQVEGIDRELGFTYSRRYVLTANEPQLVIESVAPGGAFEQAGIEAGEYIVSEESPNKVLRSLALARGRSIRLRLAKERRVVVGNGEPETREVLVHVPAAGGGRKLESSAPVPPPTEPMPEEPSSP